jgi:polyphosphate glucokinase
VDGPFTLAFDIGGTGLKAGVLDARGRLVAPRARVPTQYPCPPERMIRALVGLTRGLPQFDRVAAGFPGMVREGKVLTAPHFVTRSGPETEVLPRLLRAWTQYDLARALSRALHKPARVANDADVQGAAVIKGRGLELVLTLGTGLGTALFWKGRLLPHLELAHHPFRKGETYNEQVGERARKRIGNKRWRRRVRKAIDTLRALTFFDHCYVGGGNARRLGALPDDVAVVSNDAGLVGGLALWDEAHHHLALE